MTSSPGAGARVGTAVVGSLLGTAVFGVMMTMMGMMPMVAALVGSGSSAVGWLVHLFNGAVFGVAFGLLQPRVRLGPLVSGIAFGLLLWLVGALMLMPLILGMPGMVLNVSGSTPWYSFVGHIVYGAVLGAYVAWRTGVPLVKGGRAAGA